LAVALVLILAAVAGTAIAFPALTAQAPPQGTVTGGGTITGVKIASEPGRVATSSRDYVDLPGAETTITVPQGDDALILARFSADSFCFTDGSSMCRGQVRILIGGVEAAPGNVNFFFDETVPPNRPEVGSHATERWRAVGAGTHTVKVQWRVQFGSPTELQLAHRQLTVERAVPVAVRRPPRCERTRPPTC
jgi:hypothetical protein